MKNLSTTAVVMMIGASVLFVERTALAQEPGTGNTQRQFDSVELKQGQDLFRRNCAVCHGWNAEGTVRNWQKRDADGKLPPPPLNGTAHAWHHSTQVLHRTIRDGTQSLGGSMPPWREKLSDEEILLIIQWLTSLWPEEIYEVWLKQNQ
ncbi:MAG: cytochrome c [Gammaproteobacteria bacterium]|nr:cytochrome c [Gammaproteobacteria bacterium]